MTPTEAALILAYYKKAKLEYFSAQHQLWQQANNIARETIDRLADVPAKSVMGLNLQSQATRFLSRYQDEGTWYDPEAMKLQMAIDEFFDKLRGVKRCLDCGSRVSHDGEHGNTCGRPNCYYSTRPRIL